MDMWVWVVIIGVAVAALLGVMVASSRRRAGLKQRFGAEYDRTVDAATGRRQAEHDLRDREDRRSTVDLQPLSASAMARYQAQWIEMQARFVDRPVVAVADADSLITQVMRDLGYPIDNFESNADLISVDHPTLVAQYRDAHGIYAKTINGTATTEDLRQAVLAYRVLFEELMRDSAAAEPQPQTT